MECMNHINFTQNVKREADLCEEDNEHSSSLNSKEYLK
jgi:hypothetical protein